MTFPQTSFRRSLRLVLFTILSVFTFFQARASLCDLVITRFCPFVTRSGAQLFLDGKPFRYGGANIYWLGLDENVGGVAYPTHFRVNDALGTAKEMGATVVRAHSLGVSTGSALTVEPTLNQFNEQALDAIDYAVASAALHGIRLIIPLTDDYHYYNGGKHNFTDWEGVTEDQFYTNPAVIADFENYISHLLNHVNHINGVALKDEPAIMAWETGNEISPPTAWTQTISAYIKSVDSNHLVLDGHYGVDAAALNIDTVDLVGSHFNGTRYAMTAAALNAQAALAAGMRPYIVGEFDWSNYHGGGDLTGFLAAAQANTAVAGATYWSLFGHNDTYGYVQHGDGFTLHYPGDTPTKRTYAQQLRSFAYQMSGLSVPPDRIPNRPVITSVDALGDVAWRGSIAGDTYEIQRSTRSVLGPWTTVTQGTVTDNGAPFNDSEHPVGRVWYRVRAANLSGVNSLYSEPFVATLSSQSQLIDLLNDWSHVTQKTVNLAFDGTNTQYFTGDTSRVRRTVDDTESFIYAYNNITSLKVRVYTKVSSTNLMNVFKLAISTDGGNTFVDLPYAPGTGFSGGGGGWTGYDVTPSGTLPAGVNALRITLQSGTGYSYDPEVSQVTLIYGN